MSRSSIIDYATIVAASTKVSLSYRLSQLITVACVIASSGHAWGNDSPSGATTQPATPTSDLVTTADGDLPILISAPHGGTDRVPGVSARRGRGVTDFVTVTDTNTAQLTEKLAKALERVTGSRPYLVVARFDRKFIDANRDEADAFESPQAAVHYYAYHAAMARDCDEIVRRFGRGIVIDLHGQGVNADVTFRGTQNGSSVAHLIHDFGNDALLGKDSVIEQMQKRGYSFLPEPASNGIGKETKFDGGYITATYGAAKQPHMDAIQFETGASLRGTATEQDKTADDLAASLADFIKTYYQIESKAPPK